MKHRGLKRLILPISLFFIVSCTDQAISLFQPEVVYDIPESRGVEIALKRAQQISQIRWVPLNNVPNNKGYYLAGEEVVGMPYSSVKELDKFVGLDVSFETFMTAVHNPRSVLYTENVKLDPYHGSNCATFYGVVCSSVVNYALNLNANYSTGMIDSLPFFGVRVPQDPSNIRLCDVLWSNGHVVMVYSIARNKKGEIVNVAVLESSGIRTRIHSYPFEEFCQRWIHDGWVDYYYKEVDLIEEYFPSPFVKIDNEIIKEYSYNEIIALSRGNCCSFRKGEDVVLNILDPNYHCLSLYKNGLFLEERCASLLDEVFSGLDEGYYAIVAEDGKGNRSDDVCFEVINPIVSVSLSDKKTLQITFSCNSALPKYVALCSRNGGKYLIHEFDINEIEAGNSMITIPNSIEHCYCKVYFATGYGTVTNEPIIVF